jgi:3-hydroxybutyryl-CoA dehydrogenase
MDIREVGVIGLGTMGAGIAEVFARAGFTVTAVEADPAALERGMRTLAGSLDRAVDRGRLAEGERREIGARVTPAGSVADLANADLVVEVVPERMEIKRTVFAELDRVCRPDTILATNTSSLSVTLIAAGTAHPGRVIGMHFFNPAPVMRLVEVVTTVLTATAAAGAVTALAERLGKTLVAVPDRAGFVANALLLPYLNHAATLLGDHYATREDIDTAMKVGAGLPMGPLTLADLIGLDTCVSILEVLAAEFGGTRCTPAPLLRRLADAGLTGRKSGRGFYDYSAPAVEQAPSGTVPGSVVLAGTEAGHLPELADLLAKAGVAVRPVASFDGNEPAVADRAGDLAAPGGPGTAGAEALVLIPVRPGAGVLSAALAAGAPAAAGLHLTGTLAEVVVTATTPPRAAEQASTLARRAGLTPVRSPDRAGLLASALLYPHLNDAVRMLQQGYASAADIDAAMTLGCGYPRGPLRMADEIGAQELCAVLASMHEQAGDPSFVPAQLLRDCARAGLTLSQPREGP